MLSGLSGGIWDGRFTPDLNNDGRFLRGSSALHVMQRNEDTVKYQEYYDIHYNGASTCTDEPYGHFPVWNDNAGVSTSEMALVEF